MKKLILLPVIAGIALNFSVLKAQNTNPQTGQDAYQNAQALVNGGVVRSIKPNKIEGNPYLPEEYSPGIMVMQSDSAVVDLLIRYNMYHDQVEIKIAADSAVAVTGYEIKKFVLKNLLPGEADRMFSNGYSSKSAGIKPRTFLEVHYSKKGSYELLQYHSVYLSEPSQMGYGSNSLQPKTFEKTSKLFAKYPDGKIRKFKANRKNILTLFKDKESDVKDFIKRSKTNFSNLSNIAKVFEYYDQLKEKDKK